MLRIRSLVVAIVWVVGVSFGVFGQEASRTIVEDFTTDPSARGWEIFGDPELVRWDSVDRDLNVTWDSSRSNSYLRLPLGTIMTRQDDFEVALDLLLNDFAAGVTEAKRGTFQFAFGFQNYTDASQPTFLRAAPNAAPNLVEFNFMPDTGFGPTVWPAVMSTNGAMNYSGASDFSVFDLPVGGVMRISLVYRATNETTTITITTNGILVGPITIARLATNDVSFGKKFTQFKVDTFAISSYSDDGQGAFPGSILAHGIIDNVEITVPPPPIRDLVGQFHDGIWQASFLSRTNWSYTLESTVNFQAWSDIGSSAVGTGGVLALEDLSAQDSGRFYRVRAQRLD